MTLKPCIWIESISRPLVLFFLIILYLLIILVLFPAFATAAYAQPLDLLFYYSPDKAYTLIESYGPQVRHSYAISALTLDVIYPLTYSLMFSVWLSLLLKQGNRLKCAITMLPFVILIFDLFENSGIVVMLLNYPQRLDIIAQMTSLATTTKWTLVILVLGLTLSLSMVRLFQYIRNRAS